jgi:protein-tyrosine phosphatase
MNQYAGHTGGSGALVAPGAVELHFHLLPGVDDGPADVRESVELARAAVRDGTGTIVATPHLRHDFWTDVSALVDLALEVRSHLRAACVPVCVRCGAEVGHRMIGELGADELAAVAQDPPYAQWVLVETPFDGIDADFHGATSELRSRGFGVVLAHPERSSDQAAVWRELSAGSRLQVNALSLTGGHGSAAQETADALLCAGVVTAIASDAHGTSRPPALRAAAEAIVRRGLGAPRAHRLTHAAPRELLRHGIPAATRNSAATRRQHRLTPRSPRPKGAATSAGLVAAARWNATLVENARDAA